MIDQIENDKCTGCKMCQDICPAESISYKADGKGFFYPVVDYQSCSRCRLCITNCPALTAHVKDKKEPKVYFAWAKDDEIRMRSTSGGIYTVLAKDYINSGKYIAGCRYSLDCKSAHHVICNDSAGLSNIAGSKYIQSDTASVYRDIEALLKEGKEVLFCGTPCQSAALQRYMGGPCKGLVTVDFVCKGVSSPKAYAEHISKLEEKFKSKVSAVHMKNKRKGWHSLGILIKFKGGGEYFRKGWHDPWVREYINNMHLRPSCYNCGYRTLPRVSDITLGDFWGIRGVDKKELFKGISLVMINSPEGEKLFVQVKESMIYGAKTLNEAAEGNPSLMKDSMIKGENRLKGLLKRACNIVRYVDLFKFVRFNYFNRSIIRDKGSYLITYRNSIIHLDKSARIYISGGKIELGSNKLKGSRAETYLRMGENSVWRSEGGALLYYNTLIEIQKDAQLDTGYFSANCDTKIICSKKITIGNDVMMGRNIVVYDSDHHRLTREGKSVNPDLEVNIEDHVWLTKDVTVLKGSNIGKGSIIAVNTVLKKDVPPRSMAVGNSLAGVTPLDSNFDWSREKTYAGDSYED